MKAASSTLFGVWEGVAYSVLGDTIGGCVLRDLTLPRTRLRGAVRGEKRSDRVVELAHSLNGWCELDFSHLWKERVGYAVTDPPKEVNNMSTKPQSLCWAPFRTCSRLLTGGSSYRWI